MRVKGRVGAKGQVVVPKQLREKFKISPGDAVLFDATGDAIVVYPSVDPEKFVSEFINMVKKKKRAPKKIDWDKLYYSQFR